MANQLYSYVHSDTYVAVRGLRIIAWTIKLTFTYVLMYLHTVAAFRIPPVHQSTMHVRT